MWDGFGGTGVTSMSPLDDSDALRSSHDRMRSNRDRCDEARSSSSVSENVTVPTESLEGDREDLYIKFPGRCGRRSCGDPGEDVSIAAMPPLVEDGTECATNEGEESISCFGCMSGRAFGKTSPPVCIEFRCDRVRPRVRGGERREMRGDDGGPKE